MHKKLLTSGIVASVLLAACSGSVTGNPSSSPGGQTTSSVSQDTGLAPGTKIADSPYASSAYLISGDPSTFDDATKTALSGFTVQRQRLVDGSLRITLTATNPEYQTQIYTLKPDQKLYFIEKALGDDAGGQDRTPRDDTAVVTDSGGTVVQP
jgi:TolA-binding protein